MQKENDQLPLDDNIEEAADGYPWEDHFDAAPDLMPWDDDWDMDDWDMDDWNDEDQDEATEVFAKRPIRNRRMMPPQHISPQRRSPSRPQTRRPSQRFRPPEGQRVHPRMQHPQRRPSPRLHRYPGAFRRRHPRIPLGSMPGFLPPMQIPLRPHLRRNILQHGSACKGLVYLWMEDGSSFWTQLSFVSEDWIAGYFWDGNDWEPFAADPEDIYTFVCF